MRKLSFVLLIFLMSCGSQKRSLEKVDNRDFGLNFKYNYNSKQDAHSIKDKVLEGFLAESFYHLQSRSLVPYTESPDPFTKIVSECYSKDWSDADKHMAKNYKANKGNPIYWNIIGVCYLQQKDFLKASLYLNTSLYTYRRATKSQGYYAPAYNNLAMAYYEMGDISKAKIMLENIVNKRGNLLVPKYNLALIYLKNAGFNRSIELLTEIEKKDNDQGTITSLLAFAYLGKARFDKAIQLYEKLPKGVRDKDLNAQGYLASLYLSERKNDFLKLFDQTNMTTAFSKSKLYKEMQSFYQSQKQKDRTISKENSQEKSRKRRLRNSND